MNLLTEKKVKKNVDSVRYLDTSIDILYDKDKVTIIKY